MAGLDVQGISLGSLATAVYSSYGSLAKLAKVLTACRTTDTVACVGTWM